MPGHGNCASGGGATAAHNYPSLGQLELYVSGNYTGLDAPHVMLKSPPQSSDPHATFRSTRRELRRLGSQRACRHHTTLFGIH